MPGFLSVDSGGHLSRRTSSNELDVASAANEETIFYTTQNPERENSFEEIEMRFCPRVCTQ